MPRMSMTTPTVKSAHMPVSRGVSVTLSNTMMSAIGKMDVSDSIILSFNALVIFYPFLSRIFLLDLCKFRNSALVVLALRKGCFQKYAHDFER